MINSSEDTGAVTFQLRSSIVFFIFLICSLGGCSTSKDEDVAPLVKPAVSIVDACANQIPESDNTNRVPFIHAVYGPRGGCIVDGEGKKIKFRGVNLGGWLMWESWIWGDGLSGESPMNDRLSAALGETEARQFRSNYYLQFIQEGDIELIGQLGYNVVRVPFNHLVYDRDELFPILDRLLGWAEKFGVYVILDLHAAPKPQNQTFVADWQDSDVELWVSWPDHRDAAPILWRSIAERYRNRKIIAGYDLLNEPLTGWDAHPFLAEEYTTIIKAIREVDTNHMLVLEGDTMAVNFGFLNWTAPPDANISFQFHMYYNIADRQTQLGRLASWRDYSQTMGVPMMCGEFGGLTPKANAFTKKLLNDEGDWLAGWIFWTWKNAELPPGFELSGVRSEDMAWGIRKVTVGSNWKTVMNYLTDSKVPAPDSSVLHAGMGEFLHFIALPNTLEDTAQRDAMTPKLPQ